MKKVETIFVEDGELYYSLCSTAANDDWVHANRVTKKAEAGNKKAKQEIKNMHEAIMVKLT